VSEPLPPQLSLIFTQENLCVYYHLVVSVILSRDYFTGGAANHAIAITHSNKQPCILLGFMAHIWRISPYILLTPPKAICASETFTFYQQLHKSMALAEHNISRQCACAAVSDNCLTCPTTRSCLQSLIQLAARHVIVRTYRLLLCSMSLWLTT
jgi:hypothetical protein